MGTSVNPLTRKGILPKKPPRNSPGKRDTAEISLQSTIFMWSEAV